MDIMSVLNDTIDVRDGFKNCGYFTINEVEDVINDMFELKCKIYCFGVFTPQPNFVQRGIVIASTVCPSILSPLSVCSNLVWATTPKLYMTMVIYLGQINLAWKLCTVRLF